MNYPLGRHGDDEGSRHTMNVPVRQSRATKAQLARAKRIRRGLDEALGDADRGVSADGSPVVQPGHLPITDHPATAERDDSPPRATGRPVGRPRRDQAAPIAPPAPMPAGPTREEWEAIQSRHAEEYRTGDHVLRLPRHDELTPAANDRAGGNDGQPWPGLMRTEERHEIARATAARLGPGSDRPLPGSDAYRNAADRRDIARMRADVSGWMQSAQTDLQGPLRQSELDRIPGMPYRQVAGAIGWAFDQARIVLSALDFWAFTKLRPERQREILSHVDYGDIVFNLLHPEFALGDKLVAGLQRAYESGDVGQFYELSGRYQMEVLSLLPLPELSAGTTVVRGLRPAEEAVALAVRAVDDDVARATGRTLGDEVAEGAARARDEGALAAARGVGEDARDVVPTPHPVNAEATSVPEPQGTDRLAGGVGGQLARPSLKAEAIRAGVADEIDGPYEVFAHGTRSSVADDIVDSQGGVLSSTGGNFAGSFHTVPDAEVAQVFADRSASRVAGEGSALVGVALPQEVADRLRQQGMLRREPIQNPPPGVSSGAQQWVFGPAAIAALKRDGFFFEIPSR